MVKNSVSSKVYTVGIHGKCHCLAVVIRLHGGFNLMLINVYFRCFETGQEYRSALLDCMGFTESCILLNDHDAVLILGDCNFVCDMEHAGYQLWCNLCNEYNLVCCESVAQYTYCHDLVDFLLLIICLLMLI